MKPQYHQTLVQYAPPWLVTSTLTSGKPGLVTQNETAAQSGFACMELLEANMKISELVKKLEDVLSEHGDIQTTCTHSLIQSKPEDIFETTIENLEVHSHKTIGKCVRVWM